MDVNEDEILSNYTLILYTQIKVKER
jgi:hypothetical protein